MIFLLLVLIIYNIVSNRELKNVDRKVHYIFNYTYDEAYNRSIILFQNAIKLVTNNFEFEKDQSNKDMYFSIGKYNKYKRIINYQIIYNTLSYREVNNYLDNRGIIINNNKYFIEKYNYSKNNYIGSIIYIKNFDDKYVYVNSNNYYCDNYEYIGILDEEPKCDFNLKESSFTLTIEDNILKISNLNEIEKIVK